jgi:chemotaxis protein histidine kinase CheA/CheY-like chemotaxis protein
MKGSDLLLALADEVQSLTTDLAHSYEQWSTAEADADELAGQFISAIERLAEAAGYMGLTGVQRIASVQLRNFLALADVEPEMRVLLKPWFCDWPTLLEAHLRAPQDPELISEIVLHLGNDCVPEPLRADESDELLGELAAASQIGAALDAEEGAAPEQLSADDMKLDVSPDVDGALLDAFLTDSPPQALEVCDYLARWIKNPADAESLRTAKRAAHTLKGSANILGISGIGKLAHRLEDLLDICEAEMEPPGTFRARALMAAADCLAQMVAAVAGEDSIPEFALGVVAELDLARAENGDISTAPTATETFAAATTEAATPTSPDTRQAIAATRVPTALLDNLVRMVGEMSIKLGELEQEFKNASTRANSRVNQDLLIHKRLYELEHSVDIRGLAARHRIGAAQDAAASEFDSLEMDQYNEVQGISRALIEEATDARDISTQAREELRGIAGIIHEQQRMMRELQHLTAQTRMAPIESIVPRLQRNVRQTASSTGKHAQLVVAGSDILVDNDVLMQLVDPMLHVLRNAVDHGLETPEEREILGKAIEGTIRFEARQRGQVISVTCSDDGRGLDLDVIRAKAIARGLIPADTELTEQEIARLTLLPGFSTRDSVSEISGRGVGLDVVASRLRALNGTVDIRSEFGRGMTIELRFQASMIATHALFVRTGEHRYAIPSHSVLRAIPASLVELTPTGNGIAAVIDSVQLPTFDLAAITGLPATAENARQDLVLVQGEGGIVGVLVDAVLQASDLVTRPAGRYLKRIQGVTGMGLLGDGSIVSLLDIAELVRTPDQSARRNAAAALHDQVQARHRAMVVDDSLSVRRALATLLEDQGYEVAQMRDGLEAAHALDSFKPDVVLTDLEMPNMNGLELASHIRARPQHADLPIIMITSRSMDKHRQQALAAGVSIYLTKPYTDHELLRNVSASISNSGLQQAAAG